MKTRRICMIRSRITFIVTGLLFGAACRASYSQQFLQHDFTNGFGGWTTFNEQSTSGGVNLITNPFAFTLINSGYRTGGDNAEYGITKPVDFSSLDPERVWEFSWTIEGQDNNGQGIHTTLQSATGYRRQSGQPSVDFVINTDGENEGTAAVRVWSGQRQWTSVPVDIDSSSLDSAFALRTYVTPVGYVMYSDQLRFLASGVWPNGYDLHKLSDGLGYVGVSTESDGWQTQSARLFEVTGIQSSQRSSTLNPIWHGWFTRTNTPAASVADYGGETAIIYALDGWTVATWQSRLDYAQSQGFSLVIQLNTTAIRTGNLATMETFVSALDGHPALAGWYIADEPEGYNPDSLPSPPGLDRDVLQYAYDTLSPLTTAPMVVDFGFFMNRPPKGDDISSSAEEDDNPLWRYSNAYNVVIMGSYVCNTGQDEFSSFSSWKTYMDNAVAAGQLLDKAVIYNGQAYGHNVDGLWSNKRLPTAAEAIFQARYAAISEVDGIVHWAIHRIEDCIAQPGEPYPYDGVEWLDKVYGSEATNFGYLRYEINLWQEILPGSIIRGAVTCDDEQAILVKLFYNQARDKMYLLAINPDDAEAGTVRLKIDLGLINGQIGTVAGKYFDATAPQNVIIDESTYSFETALGPWQTRLFEISLLDTTAHGPTISVNYVKTPTDGVTPDPAILDPAEVAGLVPVGNWNNFVVQQGGGSANQSLADLINDSGATTAADFSYTTTASHGMFDDAVNGPPYSPADKKIFRRYLHQYGDGDGSGGAGDYVSTHSVSDLPVEYTENGYDLIVYVSSPSNANPRLGRYMLDEGMDSTIDAELYSWDGANQWNGSYVDGGYATQAEATAAADNPDITEGNYIRFTGLTAESFTLTIDAIAISGSADRTAINGFQIVAAGGAMCGDDEHPYPVGDVNKDCYVNDLDVSIFESRWLDRGCIAPYWCGGADVTQDGVVESIDFATLVLYWLECTDPDPPCNYLP